MQQQLTVVVPDGIDAEAKNALTVALAYKIDTQVMYELAADDLKTIKAKAAVLEAKRKEIVDPLNRAVKAVNDLFRAPADFYGRAEKALKDGMSAYLDEQERNRREQEEAARRAREDEDRRVAAEAEAARQAAEEAARQAAAAATPEEQAQAQAALDRASAKVEETAQAQVVVATMPAPIIADHAPKVAGIARKTTWRGECHDFMALVKAVAAGQAPITLLELNQSALNQMARALKTTMAYPGCKAVEDKGIAAARG